MNIKKFNKYVQKYKIQSMNIEVTLPPVGGLSSQIHMGLCILLKGYFSNHYNIYDIKQFRISGFSLCSILYSNTYKKTYLI